MSAVIALQDSVTLFRRQARRLRRYPEMTVMVVGMPVVFLLLFVFVFGGTLGAGLPGGAGTRGDYADYVVPGILVMAIATVAQGTAVSVAMDMTQGVITRLRTLPIAHGAVLTGHVLSSVLQCLASLVVVIGVALVVGFRPAADPLGWLGAATLLTALALAISWLAVACGLVARSVESASNLPVPLTLLPFLGSGFVPTDSMPAVLAWFAEHQPFTPIMDSLRGLLLDTPVAAATLWLAVGWCAGLTAVGWVAARRAYTR